MSDKLLVSNTSCVLMTQLLQNCSHCLSGNMQRETCGKTCLGDRDDEWMGVSLARQDRADGRILVSSGT